MKSKENKSLLNRSFMMFGLKLDYNPITETANIGIGMYEDMLPALIVELFTETILGMSIRKNSLSKDEKIRMETLVSCIISASETLQANDPHLAASIRRNNIQQIKNDLKTKNK